MPKIFVSYRRTDSASETGRIVYHLGRRFGKKTVFNDVFDIKGGQRFRDVISSQLRESKVVLVVIGNQWLSASDNEGQRRLADPDDYVRFEIEAALSQPECVVIPVLVNHQQVPTKADLPKEIAPLVDRNAIHVRPDPDFQDDVEGLCRIIAEHVPPKKMWPKNVAAAGIVVSFIVAAFFLGPGTQTPDTVVRAFDSSTGERVLRPFSLEFRDGERSPAAVEQLLVDQQPDDFAIDAVECRGFMSSFDEANVAVTKSEEGFFVNLPLSRATDSDEFKDDIDFFEAIKPNIESIIGLPTDEQIRNDVDENTVPPEDVELIVHNRTQQHLDVLLYWLPPSDHAALQNPFAARWTHINSGAIAPGEKARFNAFQLKPGYFVFFASTNGTEARKLYSAALYKAAYALATITEVSEHGLSLSFSATEPSEFANP